MGTTILLVDDDAEARRTLSSLLQGFGIQVVEADIGHNALMTKEGLVPDIVLSGCNMPGMKGVSLLRELRRSHPSLGGVPFIQFSNFIEQCAGTTEDPAPDVVLCKPVSVERLLCEINAVLKRRHSSRGLQATANPQHIAGAR